MRWRGVLSRLRRQRSGSKTRCLAQAELWRRYCRQPTRCLVRALLVALPAQNTQESAVTTCSVDGVPRRGAIKEVAAKFRVDRRTISMVWKKAKAEEARSGQLRADYSGNARGRLMLDLSEKL
ncbi:hypothetical protein PI125_g3379 [Phytophthora idaei]|nr:hypothetical protein PI125_g3379 [Phytophthora idaei]